MQVTPRAQRRLFQSDPTKTPVRVEMSRIYKKREPRPYIRRTCNRRKSKKFNIDQFRNDHHAMLGRYITELCVMKFQKHKFKKPRYSAFQKFMSTNMMIGASFNGYRLLRKMFQLPSTSTILRSLAKFRTNPGISKHNIEMLKMKINITPQNKYCFILLDEITLRRGCTYNKTTGTIVGFADNGKERTSCLATHGLCVMAAGILKPWKYPLGYFFTHSTMDFEQIRDIIHKAITCLEHGGYVVKGLTTDQGGNFDKVFKILGVKPSNPKFELNGKSYYVLRDPPHLIKNCRNYLLKGPVHVPKYGKAC